MKTKLLKPNQIDEAVLLLQAGNVVALPTETVYGLAADARNKDAIDKIFIAKNRPINHPLILHIESIDKAKEWVDEIPEVAFKLSQNFWPGPLTMLFKKRSDVSSKITGGSEKIALRVPNHDLMMRVIKRLGGPLVAPSANSFKKLSPTRPEHVLNDLSNKISAVLDGGPCSVGIESTIIDITSDNIKILRPGAVTQEMIEQAIKRPIQSFKEHNEQVSGNLRAHYQPRTPIILLKSEEIAHYLSMQSNSNTISHVILDEGRRPEDRGSIMDSAYQGNDISEKWPISNGKWYNIALVHYSNLNQHIIKSFKMPADRVGYSKNIYDVLHQVDLYNFEKVLIEIPPEDWLEVNDRLTKAASLDS